MKSPRSWSLAALSAIAATITTLVAVACVPKGPTDAPTTAASNTPTKTATKAPTGGAADPPKAVSVSSLPPRNVVGYWQGWGAPKLRLLHVPRQFTIVMAAFAVGDATGRVRFTQTVQSQASFVADVDSLHRAGQRVVLSVGGWNDGGLKITNEAQRKAFLDSVTSIIDDHHFQGIDWDLEHGLDPEQLAEATFALKAKYGPRFLITMAPTLDSRYERQQFELGARIKSVLDLANIQFYNRANLTTEFVLGRTLKWGQVVGMDKVGMGFITVQSPTDTGIRTPAAVCALWRSLIRSAPKARGIMTWSINLDRTTGHQFARTCAPVILAGR